MRHAPHANTDTAWDAELADANGLVSIGGDLACGRLLSAYRAGIFPWYEAGYPVCWWSPNPRAIFDLETFHVPRRLARTIRAGKHDITVNRDFAGVIHGCADRPQGTWITAEMIAAYTALHERGYAHSVETRQGDRLVGGLYGVAIGGFFAGESMFAQARDASKIALAHTVRRLQERGYQLFDIQFRTEHTSRMGATEISRGEYLKRLHAALSVPARFA
jgi:leucyl/phenylalanyl-tRNA--protein transferase